MGLSGYFIINEKWFQHNIAVESWPLDELKQELLQAISEWNSFFQQQTEGEKKLSREHFDKIKPQVSPIDWWDPGIF